jgi:ubiquitin fusion degradation protein 1
LEFTAEEGRVYLPQWMMSSLSLTEGDLVTLKNVSLPTGKFVKIQPQSTDFLDISDPKTVLERVFRDFSTLTQGDVISVLYNGKVYDILVMEVRPNTAISILDTDLEVDFAPPLGYVEPVYKKPVQKMDVEAHVETRGAESFVAFKGLGAHLAKGTEVKGSEGLERPKALNLPPGKLFFGYTIPAPVKDGEKDGKDSKEFLGEGNTLRASKKAKK